MFQFRKKKWPLLLWGLVVFFLPFERIPSLEIKGLTLRLSHFFYLALSAGFALQVLWNKKKPAVPKFYLPLILFFAFSALSLTQSPNPGRSLAVTGRQVN